MFKAGSIRIDEKGNIKNQKKSAEKKEADKE